VSRNANLGQEVSSGIRNSAINGRFRSQPAPTWTSSSAIEELLHHHLQEPELVSVENDAKIQSFGMFVVIPEGTRGALLGDIPYQENNISRQVLRLYCYVLTQKCIGADIFYKFIL